MGSKNTSSKIKICMSCRHKNTVCRPGYELISRLQAAISRAGEAISEDFEISGTARLVGCGRECTVAYHGSVSSTYLFGDISAEVDIENLVEATRKYELQIDQPAGAKVASNEPDFRYADQLPAAVIAMENSPHPLH